MSEVPGVQVVTTSVHQLAKYCSAYLQLPGTDQLSYRRLQARSILRYFLLKLAIFFRVWTVWPVWPWETSVWPWETSWSQPMKHDNPREICICKISQLAPVVVQVYTHNAGRHTLFTPRAGRRACMCVHLLLVYGIGAHSYVSM